MSLSRSVSIALAPAPKPRSKKLAAASRSSVCNWSEEKFHEDHLLGWRFLWKSYDIRRKLLITLGLLALYRLAANVPAPGVDAEALRAFSQSASAQGGFLGFLDLLSGGTVSNFSILAMGVYPYITAQIILQLLMPIIPALQQRMQDDPREGRKWMEKWTYYLAVPMAALSAIGQINIINSLASSNH